MSKLATYEGVFEDGHVTLPPEADIPDKTRVYVLVPGAERTYKVLSPRFANPELAQESFQLVVVDESDDDGSV